VFQFYLIFTTLPVTVFYALYLTFPEGDPTITDPEARAADPAWRRTVPGGDPTITDPEARAADPAWRRTVPGGDPTITDPEARAADPAWRRFIVYSNIRTVVEEIGLSHYACNFSI